MPSLVLKVVLSIDKQLVTVLALNAWHLTTMQVDVMFNVALERLEIPELLIAVLAAELFYLGTVNSISVSILLSLLSVPVPISLASVSVFPGLVSQHNLHLKMLFLLHSALQPFGYVGEHFTILGERSLSGSPLCSPLAIYR